MAKKSNSLKDTLKLQPKTPVKRVVPDLEKTEKAVQKIHSPQGRVKRITIDVPVDLHGELKIKTFKSGITIKKYILGLVREDLGL